MTEHQFHSLTFRSHYVEDSQGRAAVRELLRDIFGADLRGLDFCGWNPSYTPFSYFTKDGTLVANVAVFDMPLMLEGRRVDAMGVQSVATRPDWRHRGLYHDLMRRAMDYCSERSELQLLLTDHYGLYEPFGFRTVKEWSFLVKAPPLPSIPPRPRRRMGGGESRELSPKDPEALALLLRLLKSRTPVSMTCGLISHVEMFFYNLATMTETRLHHLTEHDVIIASEWIAPGRLRLHDIVGATIPSLREILVALDEYPRAVEICFPPDRLDCNTGWSLVEQPLELMARGKFVDDTTPIIFPQTARF